MHIARLRSYKKDKIVNIFFTIIFDNCFKFSKEPSQSDDSFEYPQLMSFSVN